MAGDISLKTFKRWLSAGEVIDLLYEAEAYAAANGNVDLRLRLRAFRESLHDDDAASDPGEKREQGQSGQHGKVPPGPRVHPEDGR